ncbi:MAG: DUF2973 domain-containing protein [Microcoleaceae cyanobacterium]
MLHLLYVLAFTVLAFLAVRNMIRSLITIGMDSQRSHGEGNSGSSRLSTVPHPELLDESGRVTKEPLLVMRSLSTQDVRDQLNQLYNGSSTQETRDED